MLWDVVCGRSFASLPLVNMTPKFADMTTWHQAELLMQPTFIRLIDNIRKQLEQSQWKGTYRDVALWAEEVPLEVRETVAQLQQQLKTASPTQAAEIEVTLAHLPAPFPGYYLRLDQNDRQVEVDLWELCYQICFEDYSMGNDRQPVAVDTSLIDDLGEVDWHRLDDKARQVVEQVFDNLP